MLALAFGFWLLAVVSFALGLTEPGVFTFFRTFVVPALVVVVMWPLCVARLTRQWWFPPAVGVWLAVSVPGMTVFNALFFGIGQRCIPLSLVAGFWGCVAICLIWLGAGCQSRDQIRVGSELVAAGYVPIPESDYSRMAALAGKSPAAL